MRLLLLLAVHFFLAEGDVLGWAGWSPWTSCTRTCGGGVAQQLRRCLDVKCSGISVRYRICNTKECNKPSRTPRDTVCGGETILSKQQCEVVCRSRSSGAKFLWRVADGTQCESPSQRSVCSKGTCQVVGCDDVIGSSLRFDACGVCGGRGDTCDAAQFSWRESGEFTPCAKDCEEAARMAQIDNSATDLHYSYSVSVCVNTVSSRVVPERMCADRKRPAPTKKECPLLVCPSKWLVSDWSECVPACGSGTRTRSVYCVQQHGNQSINVPERFCTRRQKPASTESCSMSSCGRWEAGDWTACSASCGTGVRTRPVTCIGGSSTDDCEGQKRPLEQQSCYAGTPCNVIPPMALISIEENGIDWSERRFLDGQSWSGADTAAVGTPRLVTGAWGSCSASCGTGVSSRSVECVALHPMTRNIIQLPDSECSNLPQPPLFQPCEERPCPLQEDAKEPIDNSPFRWEHGEWGQCSASCLGGKQKAQLKCVEVSTRKTVSWNHCDARRRPPERVRACNAQPCPATWQVGRFTECSATCGSGTKSRAVKCMRPVSRTGGADAILILPDDQCPSPKPPDTQGCAQVSCPAIWIAGEWSECSASCGIGEQKRRVDCEGRDQKGRRERREGRECAAQRPHDVQMCNLGACGKPQLHTNRVFQQAEHLKKLTLALGGEATVYQGTSIKIKCPRKNYDKKKIYWSKNGKRIRNDAHLKVSTNGNLRIFHARMEDAGLYECYTDKLQGNLTLHFKYQDDDDKVQNSMLTNMLEPGNHEVLKHSKQYNITRLQNLLTEASDNLELVTEMKKYGDLFKITHHIGHWTECHQRSCSVHGFQARDISCIVTVEGGYKKRVDDAVCTTLGAPRPPSTRPCQKTHCPKWEASEWTDCNMSRCIRDSTAQQRRTLKCVAQNGTEVEPAQCDKSGRPKQKKECVNERCKAEWRANEWGQCSSTCGSGGMQLRMLQCVWSSSGKAAGRSCEGARRPPAARPCPQAGRLPACTPTALPLQDASCEDLSRFCDIIKLFHSCDSAEVRQRCCSSCARVERPQRL